MFVHGVRCVYLEGSGDICCNVIKFGGDKGKVKCDMFFQEFHISVKTDINGKMQ